MTEKRFAYYEEDLGDMVLPKCLDDGKTVAKSVYECVDLLNQLNDENEQLKESNERFSKTVAEQIIIIKEYREKNEQLKEELYQQEVSEQRRKEYDEFWKEKMNKGLVK